LFWAVRNGWEETAEHSLVAGASIDAKDHHERSPLHLAAGHGQLRMVDFFLAIPGNDINATDFRNRTPLFQAVLEGYHEEMVGRLLDHPDIQPNLAEDTRWHPVSPDDYGPYDQPSSGETPLSHAAAQGFESIVDLLLRHPRVDVNSKDRHGRTPLTIAILRARESVVKQLLAAPGVSVNEGDKFGNTPLMYAAMMGLGGIVELLLDNGDIEIDTVNEGDDMALHLAARTEQKRVVELLLEKGCAVCRTNTQGFTPATLASQYGHDAVAQLLSSWLKPTERP
jgi:ankyrin repeat protein